MDEKLKVLIIEDELDFYHNYREHWDTTEIDTSHFKSLEVLESQLYGLLLPSQPDQKASTTPQLIILDLELIPGQLPEEGIQTLRYILQMVETIPVIVVSEWYNPATRGRILDLGAIDLIDKNDIINDQVNLKNVCQYLARNFVKSEAIFKYLENSWIGISEDAINTGERIVNKQKYYFCTQSEFRGLIHELLLDTKICPAYFFPNKESIALSDASIHYLIQLAQSEKKLSSKDLKNILRVNALAAYKRESSSTLILDIDEISRSQTEMLVANPEQIAFQKLNNMMQISISSRKAPELIPGLKEQFLEIYCEYPNILSEDHQKFFKIFIPKKEETDKPKSVPQWYEKHFYKSLFLAGLIAIVVCIAMKLFSQPVTNILGFSAIAFCVAAFFLIRNDPKNKYYRAGIWVIGLVGIINTLPLIDATFIAQGESNTPWEMFIKFIIQDSLPISIGLLVVALVLFILQYFIDRNSQSKI